MSSATRLPNCHQSQEGTPHMTPMLRHCSTLQQWGNAASAHHADNDHVTNPGGVITTSDLFGCTNWILAR
eukprot:1158287-Pelagomonas_calceolata.AAC.2